MKNLSRVVFVMLTGCLFVSAGAMAEENPFDKAVRPITNPAYFDLAVPQNYVHPIFFYQTLPDKIDTALGKVDLDGDVQVYAVAAELALSERFSLLAAKDGFIDFNPDETLSDETGWADITAGVKWAFLYDRAKKLAGSAKLLFDLPSGSDDVFQGNGDGTATPSVSILKLGDRWQVAGTVGLMLPFDTDEESTLLFDSWHISYAVTENFFPLLELNHFCVLSSGDGEKNFDKQAGGLVPAIAKFEGGDLVNLGAENSDDNRNIVTMGIGFRYRLTQAFDLGLAFEFPLTDDEKNLMETRTTFDLIWRY